MSPRRMMDGHLHSDFCRPAGGRSKRWGGHCNRLAEEDQRKRTIIRRSPFRSLPPRRGEVSIGGAISLWTEDQQRKRTIIRRSPFGSLPPRRGKGRMGGTLLPDDRRTSTEKDYHPEITPFPGPRSARPASPIKGEAQGQAHRLRRFPTQKIRRLYQQWTQGRGPVC